MTAMNQYSTKLEITPHSDWAQKFWDELVPAKERVSKHPLFVDMANGDLSLECIRSALLNFYPLVAHFPSYTAGALAKATDFALDGVTETRDRLVNPKYQS